MSDSPTPTSAASSLDLLAAELDRTVPQPTITIAVKGRPGWAVRYRTDISQAEIADWRKTAETADGIDSPLLNRILVANTCLGFVHQSDDGSWTAATDDSGHPMTFGSIVRRGTASTVADAVKSWLITDGQILGTSDRIYAEAGYSRMPDTIPDPTRP